MSAGGGPRFPVRVDEKLLAEDLSRTAKARRQRSGRRWSRFAETVCRMNGCGAAKRKGEIGLASAAASSSIFRVPLGGGALCWPATQGRRQFEAKRDAGASTGPSVQSDIDGDAGVGRFSGPGLRSAEDRDAKEQREDDGVAHSGRP